MLQLCCLRDEPVLELGTLSEKWAEGAEEHFSFASDRYNYLYVRKARDSGELPWDKQKCSCYVAVTRLAGAENRDKWTRLQTNSLSAEIALDGTTPEDVKSKYAKEPFLIPMLPPGDYTIIAELHTGSTMDDSAAQRIGCDVTTPYVWEQGVQIQPDRDKTIIFQVEGNNWDAGSWRYLSDEKTCSGSLTKSEDVEIEAAANEKVFFIAAIRADQVSKLAGLGINTEERVKL